MEISPDALLDQYRRAVWRSEGMLAMTNAHLLLISGFLGGGHQCYLNGIYGGPTNYSAEYYAERHLTDAFSFDEKVRDICDVIAVAPSLYRPACGEALVARLERARTASVARELEKQLDVSDRFCDQRDALLIENRMRRFICQGALYRFAWEEQLPLSNYGLYRFYLGTPPEFKLYRRLLKATLTGSWPALAAIRDSNTGLNLYQTTGRWREFRINMQTRLRYYVARASFGRLTVLDRSTYAHYSDWFRSHSGTYRFFTQQVTAPWLQELVGSTRPALLDFAGGVRRRGWGFEHLVRLATLGVWYQVFVLGNGARPPEEDGGPARPTPKEESAPWK
jgi:hypothetical protein